MVGARRCASPAWFFVVVLSLVSALNLNAWGCRLLDPPAERSDTLWVHLEGLCLPNDRGQWAVKGAEVLEALKTGKSLDLQGALVVGDVLLDQLPLQPLADIPGIPLDIQSRLRQRGLESVRVIPGAMMIRDSQFEKVLATNLSQGALVVLGDVEVSETTFLQSVDFSKMIFAKPMVFTNSHVEYEGFFIGAQFEQAVDFSHTVFGVHSRFHKAIFRAPVNFSEVQFKGVAEFLEVDFQEGANFSQVHFLSGTGFSGSVFHGHADFSGIETQKELYFRFSEFRQGVSFRGADFQSVVDFSNAQFEGEHDFSGVGFAVQPDFTASNITIDVPIARRWGVQQSQWLVVGGMVILGGILLWWSTKNK